MGQYGVVLETQCAEDTKVVIFVNNASDTPYHQAANGLWDTYQQMAIEALESGGEVRHLPLHTRI